VGVEQLVDVAKDDANILCVQGLHQQPQREEMRRACVRAHACACLRAFSSTGLKTLKMDSKTRTSFCSV
jgi:hypothetical protein